MKDWKIESEVTRTAGMWWKKPWKWEPELFIVTQLCPTLCDPMKYNTPDFPVHHHLLEFAKTHIHWVSDAIQPFHPLSSPSPSVFMLSSISIFSNVLALCTRWPKYWSFRFHICLCNEYSGLISFSIDWCDLLAVQGTLKSLLQHHSMKVLILTWLDIFIVQLSHPYMITWRVIALAIRAFVGNVMSLLFNTLSRSGPITSWERDGETVETVSDFIFGNSKITADCDCSHE